MLLQDAVVQLPSPKPGDPAPVKVFVDGKQVSSPEAVYKGMIHRRDELGSQMERLKDERQDVANRLQGEPGEQQISAADKAGLEKRLTTLDGRIEALDQEIAGANAQVASAAAVPGAIVERPPQRREGPPEEVFVLGGIFLFVAIFPISIAFARRIWRRSAAAVAALPHDIVERFTQIDQAVESIAVEVERIGEGQRFITRVLAEQGRPALADPGQRGVEVRARPNG